MLDSELIAASNFHRKLSYTKKPAHLCSNGPRIEPLTLISYLRFAKISLFVYQFRVLIKLELKHCPVYSYKDV